MSAYFTVYQVISLSDLRKKDVQLHGFLCLIKLNTD